MINQINASTSILYQTDTGKKTAGKSEKKTAGEDTSAYRLDISITAGAKGNRALSSKEIEALKNQTDAAAAALKDVVEKLIVGQKSNSSTFSLNIEILTAAGAVEPADISQDPEWGVEAVSDRIVDFAKSISGGDPGKLEILREAIDKGFACAKNLLGGKLPSVSMDTYDAVMQKLDDWAAESGPVPVE